MTDRTDTTRTTCSATCNLFGFRDKTQEQQLSWQKDFEIAQTLAVEGDPVGSIQLLRKCLASAPAIFYQPSYWQSLCYLRLGLTETKIGKLQDAAESLRSGLKVCDGSGSGLVIKIQIQASLAHLLESQNKHKDALAAYIISLRLVNHLKSIDSKIAAQINPLRCDILKEASGLSLELNKDKKAEGYLLSLASLQDPGIERGKTLLLLGQVYSRNGKLSSAIKIFKTSQSELVKGGAEYHEPLVLANALMLEARMHLEDSDLAVANNRYKAAFTLLKNTVGEHHERTLLCGCDLAVIDIRFKRWIHASKKLDSSLSLLIQQRDTGSNDPVLQPYLDAHARVEHYIGNALSDAEKLIASLPDSSVTLPEVNKRLRSKGLNSVCTIILQHLRRDLSKTSLTKVLQKQKETHLNLSLTRYTQLASSLQHQQGGFFIGLAELYDLMSNVCYSLNRPDYGGRLKRKAEVIRLRNNKLNGGD